jgi:hypothetical protein
MVLLDYLTHQQQHRVQHLLPPLMQAALTTLQQLTTAAAVTIWPASPAHLLHSLHLLRQAASLQPTQKQQQQLSQPASSQRSVIPQPLQRQQQPSKSHKSTTKRQLSRTSLKPRSCKCWLGHQGLFSSC